MKSSTRNRISREAAIRRGDVSKQWRIEANPAYQFPPELMTPRSLWEWHRDLEAWFARHPIAVPGTGGYLLVVDSQGARAVDDGAIEYRRQRDVAQELSLTIMGTSPRAVELERHVDTAAESGILSYHDGWRLSVVSTLLGITLWLDVQ